MGTRGCLSLHDLIFSAKPVGSGVEVIVDRFFRYEEEEKKREVMCLSTLRSAQELKLSVPQSDAHRNCMSDADLASDLLATKAALKAMWGKYTCARYLLIAKRFEKAGSSNHGQVGDDVWAICIVI